ncbi:MAG: pilus assembly protein PilP [Betaproteobacteria bacterium]
MKRLALLSVLVLLVSCGGGEFADLKDELKGLTKDLRGKIDPLPVVKPYEPVPYTGFDIPDPFGPAKIELVTKTAGTVAPKGLQPDLNRPKEPLEAFPLESMRMVGVIQQPKMNFGLVKADASVYRVKIGNYMGQNFGIITDIKENQILLRELVQDAGGDWAERQSTLQLVESGGGGR